ncbi:serine protease easter-like [Drosophila gunungcola]|uniref:Peptidase S1 domain-containing protein n=1 Tax=Drosophila gunungcola TaxID=103775 RepID=A0A9Q0BLM4_9MUSC|nr:serine protease easter-like [Drosophila gunungcola]KAI8036140.1 hypothetical protein M5D96_011000 [Drosophila gunungcola]
MVFRSVALGSLYLCGVLLSSSWAKPWLHFGYCGESGDGHCLPVEDCLEQQGYVEGKDSSECHNLICCQKKIYPQQVDSYCKNGLRPHISNGEETRIREFPWMAQLLYGDRLVPKCGGSLVGAKWVVTAAHCVPRKAHEEELRRVRLGVWDVRRQTETGQCHGPDCSPPPQVFSIDKAFAHDSYQPADKMGTNLEKHSYDIALLLLAGIVTYTEFIQPICLPPLYDLTRLAVYADYNLTIAGWGRTSEESEDTSPVKIKAHVKGWSPESCKMLYKDVGPSQMCAGGGPSRKSSCFGDSGGPVMVGNQLVGIVSLGEATCGFDRGPMVVTRVDYFVDWLEQYLLGPRSFNIVGPYLAPIIRTRQ